MTLLYLPVRISGRKPPTGKTCEFSLQDCLIALASPQQSPLLLLFPSPAPPATGADLSLCGPDLPFNWHELFQLACFGPAILPCFNRRDTLCQCFPAGRSDGPPGRLEVHLPRPYTQHPGWHCSPTLFFFFLCANKTHCFRRRLEDPISP